jgi:hypothetical protein
MAQKVSLAQIDAAVKVGNISEASRLVQLGVSQQMNFQGRHVFYANVLFASMPWREVSALLPSGTNSFQTTGWINSVLKGRPLDVNNNPIPWFTYPAIDFLESVLDPHWNIFEWGSGNSTKWWSKKCASVTAVESNPAWHGEVSNSLPANAKVVLAVDKETYTHTICNYPDMVFDLVVVDGDHRNECVEACLGVLPESGIVVFDNSDRHTYDSGIRNLQEAGFFRIDFWGLIPSYAYRNCTSVFFRNPELLKRAPMPSKHVSNLGYSCEQSIARLTGKIKD